MTIHWFAWRLSLLGALLLVQGVQEKLCFFTIHCNPSLAYIAGRDLQSSKRNAECTLGCPVFGVISPIFGSHLNSGAHSQKNELAKISAP